MKSHVLTLTLLAATAFGKECKYGTLEDNCCVCEAGYEGELCDSCTPGYVEHEGRCSNGRDGAPCSNDGLFPYFGCGGAGECSVNSKSESVLPCVCKDLQQNIVSCANKIIGETTCMPQGVRMYTPFPNSPQFDNPFSLTVVTCSETSPKLMLVPAFKEDGLTENRCDSRTGDFGGFPSECVMSGSVGGDTTVSSDCLDGIVLTNLNSTDPGKNMAEFTYAGLVISKNDFRINSGDNYENRKWFKVCASKVVPISPGSVETETIWKSVDGHDESVGSRAQSFRILGDEDINVHSAGNLESVGGDDCCDGLKIGFCLPLWAFLLLWLLMALCLGILGYTLHKTKNEIESYRNGKKYEVFDTDAEMIEHAAKTADDDDI
eukprot:TRINITY_DN14690_c0_g1_i1.p1 TRINITY_DN14690_c0_g1~~TRINITY_DN14690_c0_g1_i1.p1  ORF type:complete len:377 (+),score=100.73 TRINITY_DN14690_c0_g1_i1:61-1191(+)